MDPVPIDISSLSRDEQLRLLEELWDTLSREQSAIPVTNAQRAELDARLDDLEGEQQPAGIPWEEALRRLRTPA